MSNAIRDAVNAAAEKMQLFSRTDHAMSAEGPKLPDRGKIVDITRKLRSAMFPGFFETPALQDNSYALGSVLSDVSAELLVQAKAALTTVCPPKEAEARAESIVAEFILRLPEVQRLLATDVEALYLGDPAALSRVDVIFSYPGLLAITVYRLSHVLYTLGLPLVPRMMTEYAHEKTGIDINAGARIGSYFFIDHGTGVVIGETTVIGDYVKLYQGVTLGALSTRKGHMLEGVKRHPTLGNRVTVYAGASILGGETVIGDDCLIGSNAFVTGSVPPRTRVSNKSCELTFRKMDPEVWENA